MKKIAYLSLLLLFLALPAHSEELPYILSKEGEIVDVEIKPVPVFPDEEIRLEITIRNIGKLTWTAGDYLVYADLYGINKNLLKRVAKERGKVTIPSGTSEILLLRFKAPKTGNYSIKAGIILTEDITQVREELIESRYYDFYVAPIERKTRISGSFITENEYINITGNVSGPFVTEGANTVNNLILRLDSEISDEKRLEGLVHIRATDDPLVDPRTVSCEEAYINYFSERLDVKLGDFYQEFSDYSLSESLEGIATELRFNKLKIIPFAGREWEAENEIQYTRYVYGIRPEYKLIENKRDSLIRDFAIGLNYVSTQDDAGSLKSEHESGVADIDNRVYSVDAKLALNNGLRFETEYAYSRDDADAKDVTPAKRGNAFRFLARYISRKLWLRGKYERVNSRFNSAAGFAVQDREEYYARGIWKIAEWLSIRPFYRQYRDNINNTKSTTTKVKTPELTLSIRPIKQLRDFIIDLTQRRRYRKATDKSVDENWVTNEISLSHRIGTTYFDLGYSHRKREDKVDDSDDSTTQTASLGIRSMLEYKDLRITPSVRYSREEEKFKVSDDKDITNSAVLGLNFQLNNFDLDLYHTFLDSDRYTTNADYKKVSSDIRLRYRIGGSWDRVATIGYEHVDYNHEDNTQDYTENRAYAKLEIRF